MKEKEGCLLIISNEQRLTMINTSVILSTIFIFNAVHHGFCKKPLDWKWTSLHTFLANKKTRLKIAEVLEKFGSIDKFKIAHVKMVAPLPVYEFI